ncbi:ATPase [Termitidicoccus mucosus]|uniref:ATPase BadF/BadG/BcrA/BcrD type domain-containing protein n=1 Tax=Termitidicoccus mucosus TaxID=1184151 RepID=A0A178IGD3_9BACT|nr:hypothetical protein AW736_17340 [Opitutaceae bacterium TSB47]
MTYQIGIDGGGTKTECILVSPDGGIVARHIAPGCNPSVTGAARSREILSDALAALLAQAPASGGPPVVGRTLLCMAGSPGHWRETADALAGGGRYGRVEALRDSLAVLEAATEGRCGIVLHAGTGSFIVARAPDGCVHHAGALGWRLGDPAGGYEIGRLAAAAALVELQGWTPRTALAGLLCRHTGLAEPAAIVRHLYAHPEPNAYLGAFAPAVVGLAETGDAAGLAVVTEASRPLLDLAARVAERLFPGDAPADVPAFVSGRVLARPAIHAHLQARTALTLAAVTAAPIEGVRRLLLKR